MPEEKLYLKDLVDITNKFIKGDITQEAMGEFGQRMSIRSYIPIQEKIILIMNILSTNYLYSQDYTQELIMGEMYKNVFFKILLQGYAMIDCSDDNLCTFENYDLLYPIFNPFIITYCEEDFKLLKSIMNDSINMYNIQNLINGLESIDYETLMKASEENKQLVQKIEDNEKIVKDLKDIMLYNDPKTKELIENLQKEVRERVLNKE